MYKLPKFKTQKELFDFLVNEEEQIFFDKTAELKKADGCGVSPILITDIGKSSSSVNLLEKEVLDAVLIINTTNIMDSHKDVHIPGLWDKSLKENKRIKHLQEHVRKFSHVISDKDDLKAYVKEYTWKQLGYNVAGKTQALVFDSSIRKTRNEYMWEQYAKGNVDNHSVGMRYVKYVTCINDEDYGAQYEAWEKYYPQVVNQAEAEKSGFFWAVTEAKCIEGSAVVDGSNPITPTQEIKNIEVITDRDKTSQDYIDAVKNWLS